MSRPRRSGLSVRGLRLLGRVVRTHPWPFVGSVVGSTVYSLAVVAGTLALGWVTDEVIVPTFDGTGVDPSRRWLGAAAIVGVAVARLVGVVARRWFGNMSQRRMQRTWFLRVTDRYLSVPLSWMRSRPAGQLLAHADNDAERATMAMQPLPLSLGVVIIIGTAAVLLVRVDPLLALVGLAIFPALAAANRVYARTVEVPATAAQAAVGRVSSVAYESFDGALVVRTLGLAPREVDRLASVAGELRDARLAVGARRAAFEPALDALPNLGTVALVAVGAWRISQGAVSPGELVQVMSLFSVLGMPMRVLGYLFEELPRAVVAEDRLRGVLAAPDRPTPRDPVPLPAGPLAVELRDVAFAHGAANVLDGIDARIEPGEMVAVVGSTGSGTSTLCDLVAGLVEPDAGEVRLGGVDLRRLDPGERAAAVALVFQEPYLFADTVRENVAPGGGIDDDAIWAALATAQAERFVRRLPGGLDGVLGERGVTLSGGQRQRLALARALARRPRVLLLDDATAAVDPQVERAILDALRDGVTATTLVVAQRLSTIALADRVLYLEGGRIAGAGTHEDLLALPGYAALARAYQASDDPEGVHG